MFIILYSVNSLIPTTRVFLYFLSFLPPLRVIAVNWGIGELPPSNYADFGTFAHVCPVLSLCRKWGNCLPCREMPPRKGVSGRSGGLCAGGDDYEAARVDMCLLIKWFPPMRIFERARGRTRHIKQSWLRTDKTSVNGTPTKPQKCPCNA